MGRLALAGVLWKTHHLVRRSPLQSRARAVTQQTTDLVAGEVRVDPRRFWTAAFWAWITAAAVDFFAYGGVFAFVFDRDDPFLLEPEALFARIPAGYLALAIETIALVWLLDVLGRRGWQQGLLVGAVFGLVITAATVLGVWSIAPASSVFLGAWLITAGVQFAAAGAVASSSLAGVSTRRLGGIVLVVVIALFIVTIALQSLDIVPQTRL